MSKSHANKPARFSSLADAKLSLEEFERQVEEHPSVKVTGAALQLILAAVLQIIDTIEASSKPTKSKSTKSKSTKKR